MKCRICGEEIEENIKNFAGLLMCEKCRDKELKHIENDNKCAKENDL